MTRLPLPVLTLVPRLPPVVDGLGDYGLRLAQGLRSSWQIETHFLVGDPRAQNSGLLDSFPVHRVECQSVNGLLEALNILSALTPNLSTILLHYVGYGYAKRGCPLWLVEGLERWKRARSDRQLVTMFHEVYANPQGWNSQLVTSVFQKHLAARLVCLSDRCLTSNERFASVIARLSRGKHSHIPILPVFSSMGELDSPMLLAQRERSLVIFGGRGPRSRIYGRSPQTPTSHRQALAVLEYICDTLHIDQVIDIGPPLELPFQNIGSVPITSLGVQSPQRISDILGRAIASFTHYPTEFLGKSSSFAAFCAHGILPIVFSKPGPILDGLVPGTHYWLVGNEPSSFQADQAQTIANNAYGWYQGHRLDVQSQRFACLLKSN